MFVFNYIILHNSVLYYTLYVIHTYNVYIYIYIYTYRDVCEDLGVVHARRPAEGQIGRLEASHLHCISLSIYIYYC